LIITVIQGDKNDSFADNVFITVFTKFRLQHNLCLITQDVGLSEDIMNLGKNSSSVHSIKNIKVLRISNTHHQLKAFNYSTKNNRQKHTYNKPKTKIHEKVLKIDKFRIFKIPIHTDNNSLICSKLPSLNDTVSSNKYGSIKLVKEIAAGGEGIAYLTNNKLVCKIFKKEKLKQNKFEKLKLMISKPIEKRGICWPKDLVYNSSNEFVGFVMDQAEGFELQKSIFMPMLLSKKFPLWKKKNLVTLSKNILDLIQYLHNRNIIIGDINPFNILVKNENDVYLIDTDSFQIENYPCTVGTINYTAPEIQGKDYKSFLRTFEHEYFAVATLLFMIMHPGKAPYSQQGGGNPSANIKNGDFSYPLGEDTNGKTPPGKWRFIWSNLPYKLKEAFFNNFKNGKRISTENWCEIYKFYLQLLNKGHANNEISPNYFKIVDPIEVRCSLCGQMYTGSKKLIDEYKLKGKDPICKDCISGFSKNKASHNSYNKQSVKQTSNINKTKTSQYSSNQMNTKSYSSPNNSSKKNTNTSKNYQKQSNTINKEMSIFEDIGNLLKNLFN